MNYKEKVSFIRGLVEGLELDTEKKEVKVINAMVDLLDEMSTVLSEVEKKYGDMADQLDAVDEDLGNLEEEFYGDDDDFEMDDCCYEVTCPSCNETICLSEDIIEQGSMDCPNCGEKLEFSLEDEDECGCGCGCEHGKE